MKKPKSVSDSDNSNGRTYVTSNGQQHELRDGFC
jgi:hypothetical protein